ncbi:MAG: aldehyde ferredoxin oxidoreductase C-terminal domain-containing protein [Bacillota bacterium]
MSDIEGRPCRHAARGGLGAVLGAKGVKAVVIRSTANPSLNVALPDLLKEKSQALAKALAANPVTGQALPCLGTAVLVNMVNAMGALPTRNFSSGRFEGAENISGEKMAGIQGPRGGKGGHPCHPGCVIRCSNIYNNAQGDYLTSGLEYETLGMLGANCGIDDLDTIARADRLCDDYGLDTIETEAAIAIMMEQGLASFGDREALIGLIHEAGKGSLLGRLIGQGAAVTGRVLGAGRIPQVKGQSLASYDPRGLKGTGVTYTTSPMGADHTAGNTLGHPAVNPVEKAGQIEVSRDLQTLMATMDNLGLCLFVFFCFDNPENLQYVADIVRARTGREVSVGDLMAVGAQTLAGERAFNARAGIGAAHDVIPEFFSTEHLGGDGPVFDFTAEELQRVYGR